MKLFKIFLFLILCYSLSFSQYSEWVNYTDCSQINSLLDDRENLWVGTGEGLILLNKSTGKFINYNRANMKIPDNHISGLAKDSLGNL